MKRYSYRVVILTGHEAELSKQCDALGACGFKLREVVQPAASENVRLYPLAIFEREGREEQQD